MALCNNTVVSIVCDYNHLAPTLVPQYALFCCVFFGFKLCVTLYGPHILYNCMSMSARFENQFN